MFGIMHQGKHHTLYGWHDDPQRALTFRTLDEAAEYARKHGVPGAPAPVRAAPAPGTQGEYSPFGARKGA